MAKPTADWVVAGVKAGDYIHGWRAAFGKLTAAEGRSRAAGQIPPVPRDYLLTSFVGDPLGDASKSPSQPPCGLVFCFTRLPRSCRAWLV